MNPWTLTVALWRLQLDLVALWATAPVVVAHRLAHVATHWHEPGFVVDPEWRRMVSEKVEAALEANGHATRWWLNGAAHPFDLRRALAATRGTLRPYGRRVRANAARLAR